MQFSRNTNPKSTTEKLQKPSNKTLNPWLKHPTEQTQLGHNPKITNHQESTSNSIFIH